MFAERKSSLTKGQLSEKIPSFMNLTPMTDTLTHLLFFLLIGWTAQAVTIEGVKNLQLPPSVSNRDMVLNLTVVATEDVIKVQDLPVAVLTNGKLSEKNLDGSKIIPLYNALVRIIEQKKGVGLQPKDDSSLILLLADKKIKSDLLIKIMKTCGMVGIPNFHFGVMKK
jgi:biopolymer transport protein ExbD